MVDSERDSADREGRWPLIPLLHVLSYRRRFAQSWMFGIFSQNVLRATIELADPMHSVGA
jgi:hypothetical protein